MGATRTLSSDVRCRSFTLTFLPLAAILWLRITGVIAGRDEISGVDVIREQEKVMIRTGTERFGSTVVFCGLVLSAGCAPKMTLEDLRGMRPERPAALDELDRFVGSWAWEGTMKMTGLDEPLKVSGKSEVKWAGDKWFLQIQESASIQELGNSEGTRIWSYDAKAKKFRSSWVEMLHSSFSMMPILTRLSKEPLFLNTEMPDKHVFVQTGSLYRKAYMTNLQKNTPYKYLK